MMREPEAAEFLEPSPAGDVSARGWAGPLVWVSLEAEHWPGCMNQVLDRLKRATEAGMLPWPVITVKWTYQEFVAAYRATDWPKVREMMVGWRALIEEDPPRPGSP